MLLGYIIQPGLAAARVDATRIGSSWDKLQPGLDGANVDATSVISSYLLGGFPPESQIPPEKTPTIQKTLKNASNLPPDMCSPQNSGVYRINTGMQPGCCWDMVQPCRVGWC